MASLRSRLIAVLLVVAAAGLLVLALAHLHRAALVPLRPHRRPGCRARCRRSQHQLAEDAGPPGCVRRAGLRPPATAPGRASGPGRAMCACRRAPTASGATRADSARVTRSSSATASPTPAAPDAAGEPAARTRRSRSPRAATATSATAYGPPAEPGGGTIVAAVPLAEADATLDRLLRVEALVIARRADRARDRRGGCSSGSSLRPLDRMGATAGAIAAGELVPPREPGDAEDRGRPARAGAQRDARPARGRIRQARGERGPAAPLPRRRLARAAHAARLDPRLRRAVPDGRRRRSEPTPTGRCAASRRRPRGWACSSRTCSRWRGSTSCATPCASPSTSRPSRATPSRTRAPTAPDREITLRAGPRRDGARRRPPAPAGARQPARQRARAHAGGHAGRDRRHARGRRRADRRARPRARPAERRPAGPVRSLLALGGRPRARQGGRRPRAGDRGRHRRGAQGRLHAANAPGGGARFTVCFPPALRTLRPAEHLRPSSRAPTRRSASSRRPPCRRRARAPGRSPCP